MKALEKKKQIEEKRKLREEIKKLRNDKKEEKLKLKDLTNKSKESIFNKFIYKDEIKKT